MLKKQGLVQTKKSLALTKKKNVRRAAAEIRKISHAQSQAYPNPDRLARQLQVRLEAEKREVQKSIARAYQVAAGGEQAHEELIEDYLLKYYIQHGQGDSKIEQLMADGYYKSLAGTEDDRLAYNASYADKPNYEGYYVGYDDEGYYQGYVHDSAEAHINIDRSICIYYQSMLILAVYAYVDGGIYQYMFVDAAARVYAYESAVLSVFDLVGMQIER